LVVGCWLLVVGCWLLVVDRSQRHKIGWGNPTPTSLLS